MNFTTPRIVAEPNTGLGLMLEVCFLSHANVPSKATTEITI
jgi:hypothetical protein